MKRKGLSQVLWLIIAAAVLMMVSMALTFTTQGTLGDFASSSDRQQCEQTLQNKAAASATGDVILAPSSCYSDQGNPVAFQSKLENSDANTRDCIEVTSSGQGWDTYDETAESVANCPAP